MTRILHRHTRSRLPRAVRGDGAYIIDSEGKRYLDASGGAAVSCLGHSHPRVLAAMKTQIDAIAYAHTGFFTTEAAEALAERLVDAAPGDLQHVYLVSGGSEAMEAALKLARQYFLERGEASRRLFISRRQSYHGNTLGALAVGGNMWRRAPFDPLLAPANHVSPCFAYREQSPAESDDEYARRLADELDHTIRELGAENVIGFIAEPVVGATAGAVPAVPGYFRLIREVCDRHGVLLILDEVMCGMGRTGTLFAYESEGVVPDLVTIAKGLGAGYQPIGATLLSADIFDALRQGSGFFQHGHTYMGHATACAAALEVQAVIEEENLLENVRVRGEELNQALLERFGNHPHVGDIRGRGLFRAIELVQDRGSKEPFDPVHSLHARIKTAAMDRGMMCYPMGGTIDGARGDHVLLAPPFIVDGEQVADIAQRLGDAVDSAIAGLG
jgi:adenosylmethionine-8-amino-7-oxononanoate aminotransferase